MSMSYISQPLIKKPKMSNSDENMVTDDVKSEQENTDPQPKQPSASELEKLEEAKLRAKYPIPAGGLSGHSAFLQKKLAKGQKYFDSGDYQMARQTGLGKQPVFGPCIKPSMIPTGEAIPTPESVPVRKTSIIQPKFHPTIQAPPPPP